MNAQYYSFPLYRLGMSKTRRRKGKAAHDEAAGKELHYMLSIPMIRERIAPVCKKYPIRKAYLFGSYARGDATEKSDIDLRIEGDIKSFFMLGGIYSDLEDALGMEIDLLSKLPDSEIFKANLKKDEVPLYER